MAAHTAAWYPVHLSIEYPDRELNRLTTALRPFTVIPILIMLASIGGYTGQYGGGAGGGSVTIAVRACAAGITAWSPTRSCW